MLIEIGTLEAIFRYPIKSMGGEQLQSAELGWHGLDGDRRLAFRRINDRSGFPWLSAGKVPALVPFFILIPPPAPTPGRAEGKPFQGEEAQGGGTRAAAAPPMAPP